MTDWNLPEGTLALHGKDIVIAYDDAADARKAFDILEGAIAVADQPPAWTDRLAHMQQWTPIERQCAYLKDEIEGLGAHPLLTDALNAVDLAMRTLGKWHDDGEPGREPSKSNIRQGASGDIFDSDYARDILHIYPTSVMLENEG